MDNLIRTALAIGVVALVDLGCAGEGGNTTGSDFDNTNQNNDGMSTDQTNAIPISALQSAGFEAALALIYIDVLDNERIPQQKSQPCPFGGTRIKNPDGSSTLTNCSIFPGFMLNGGMAFTPQEGDTQGFLLTADNLVGFDGTTEFMLDGFIQEIENADGSLTFVVDFFSASASTLSCASGTCFDTDILGDPEETSLSGRVTIANDLTMTGNMNGRDGSACMFNGESLLTLIEQSKSLTGTVSSCFYPPLDDCVADANCEIECRPPFADPDPDCTQEQLCSTYGLCDGIDNPNPPTMINPCNDTPTNWSGNLSSPKLCFGESADLIINRTDGPSSAADSPAQINFPVIVSLDFSSFTPPDGIDQSVAVLDGMVLELGQSNLTTTTHPDDTLFVPGLLSCPATSPGEDSFAVRYFVSVRDACGVTMNQQVFTITCCGPDSFGSAVCGDTCAGN